MATQAAILAVGTELTSGLVNDTNSGYLARRLAELGVATIGHQVVDDHVGRIASALRFAAQTADVVIVTGGLGPTADDLTRQALAEATGRPLRLDRDCLAEITAFFGRRGWNMNRTNEVQAMVPEGAEPLINPVGTAPGLRATLNGAEVYVVPGVPAEMRHMADLHILPRLARTAGDACLAYREVHAFGAGESSIGSELADLMSRDANPLVGTTVKAGVITVRVTARADRRDEARRLADATVRTVTDRLGAYAYGTDEQTMASVVGRLLVRRDATIALAESCTGGMIGRLITDAPGASRFFVGGVVCYSNAVKADLLGVPGNLLDTCGAVSEPVAEALAAGARDRLGATYALAVTGIAGPAGGTEDKPTGLVYTALATPETVRVKRNVFPGDRPTVRQRSALTAMNMLRLELRGITEANS